MTKDGDIVLSNLTAEPRIGAVVLKWDNPSASDYYYATVTYNNASGEEVKQKVSVYSVDPDKGEGHTAVRIGGFADTNTYEFTVTPYTSDEALWRRCDRFLHSGGCLKGLQVHHRYGGNCRPP